LLAVLENRQIYQRREHPADCIIGANHCEVSDETILRSSGRDFAGVGAGAGLGTASGTLGTTIGTTGFGFSIVGTGKGAELVSGAGTCPGFSGGRGKTTGGMMN